MYIVNLSDYLKSTEIVEEEFGLEWLREKSEAAGRPNPSDHHPVPQDWRIVKDAQNEFQ